MLCQSFRTRICLQSVQHVKTRNPGEVFSSNLPFEWLCIMPAWALLDHAYSLTSQHQRVKKLHISYWKIKHTHTHGRVEVGLCFSLAYSTSARVKTDLHTVLSPSRETLFLHFAFYRRPVLQHYVYSSWGVCVCVCLYCMLREFARDCICVCVCLWCFCWLKGSNFLVCFYILIETKYPNMDRNI